MSLAVSSWFMEQTRDRLVHPKRHFTIGGSDYSDRVLRWPKLTYRADTLNLGTVSIFLDNHDRDFQFFINSPTALTTSCELSLGFDRPQGGDERISLYMGQPTGVSYPEGGITTRLQMQGKTRRLTDSALGSDITSGGLDFTGSQYFPSDLTWMLVTSHGGFSGLASQENPDIDYEKWLAWRELNKIRDVRVSAYLTGEKIYQVLNSLAYMDSMVILFRDGKLDFSPMITSIPQFIWEFTPDQMLGLNLSIDPIHLNNEFRVEGNYNPEVGRFQAEFSLVHSASQSIHGKKSARFGSKSVWFATGNDGRYLAEDRIRFYHRPTPRIALRTPLSGGLHLAVGDVVTLTESLFQLGGQAQRIVEMGVNLDQGTIDFGLEQANQRPWHFLTTVSTYNLLVRTLEPLGGDRFLAVDETTGAHRVHRTDALGWFQPLETFATALRAISGDEVLFGGPPSSGAANSVIRRSSDSGSSSVTVSSLTPGLGTVHDFFEVKSGTFLASTSSGGIWRSSDSGSTWNLTWSISGAYHVQRFFRPYSGAVWGGTGIDNSALTNGVYLWDSLDDGVNWSPRHTVVGSGDISVKGFFQVADDTYLLATNGSGIDERNVYRSMFTSPDSIAWSVVLSRVGFSHLERTSSNHLLFGFHQDVALQGGSTYRSLDGGSSWIEDARISKQGNIRLIDNGNGTLDAFSTRITVGVRTDRHRNYDPNRID